MELAIADLPQLDHDAADAKPFGIVKVDDDGVIQLYNKWESDMAGVPAEKAEGKNFFTQVAPCTNNRLVFGRFKAGVAANDLDIEMNYTFTYKMKPTNVKLRLVRHADSGTNYVIVDKK